MSAPRPSTRATRQEDLAAVPAAAAAAVPAVRHRDFWRAVAGEVLATLRPWPR